MAIDLYKNRCSVYEGEKPYIFISYSHRDIENVVKLIRQLQSLGFRIWYDSGIPAGTEWREVIAAHLKNSRCVLSLLTPNSVESKHFKREFNYADYLEKDILAVYLEECEPSPGLEMQVASQQCIKREHCENDDELLEEIARAQILLPCLDEKPDIKPDTKPETSPDPTPIADNKTPISKIKQLLEAAEKGDPQAQIDLGDAYFDGDGVSSDWRKAFEWYQKAASQNHPVGIRRVGYCFDFGHGVEQNRQKAFKYYEEAAALGDARSINNMAACYEYGEGVAKNIPKAVELYKKACDLDDTYALSNLAHCYFNGIGVPQDFEMATKLLLKSANLGDANSQFSLANRYAIGWSVPQDWDEAVYWYRKAAEQGHAKAQKKMAELYRKGLGVPVDEAEAARWKKLYDENPNK